MTVGMSADASLSFQYTVADGASPHKTDYGIILAEVRQIEAIIYYDSALSVTVKCIFIFLYFSLAFSCRCVVFHPIWSRMHGASRDNL